MSHLPFYLLQKKNFAYKIMIFFPSKLIKYNFYFGQLEKVSNIFQNARAQRLKAQERIFKSVKMKNQVYLTLRKCEKCRIFALFCLDAKLWLNSFRFLPPPPLDPSPAWMPPKKYIFFR